MNQKVVSWTLELILEEKKKELVSTGEKGG